MDWLSVVSAGTDPMFTYTNGCLFVYLFTMVIFFIMNLDIFVLCFCFDHKNLYICNLCTGIFRSFGKRLRSAEDNHCRLNLQDDTIVLTFFFFN